MLSGNDLALSLSGLSLPPHSSRTFILELYWHVKCSVLPKQTVYSMNSLHKPIDSLYELCLSLCFRSVSVWLCSHCKPSFSIPMYLSDPICRRCVHVVILNGAHIRVQCELVVGPELPRMRKRTKNSLLTRRTPSHLLTWRSGRTFSSLFFGCLFVSEASVYAESDPRLVAS